MKDRLVLLVDDDEHFLGLATRALLARGLTVEVALSAFGLVNRVARLTGQRRPDLVVLDCGLPALSGTAAIGLLAKNSRTADVPVLLVSAVDSPEHRRAAALHPLGRFRVKDGHFIALADEIERFLQVGAAFADEPSGDQA
jgi:CheY-like chemotaxis protein